MKDMAVTNLTDRSRHNNKDNGKFNLGYLFDDLPDGVCVINEHGDIKYINRAYERIAKVSNGMELGESIFLTRNDDVILTAFRQKKAVSGNLKYTNGESQISVSASPISTGNQFMGVIAIYRIAQSLDRQKKNETVIELNSPHDIQPEKLNNPFDEIIGSSNELNKALNTAYKASKISSTVLIRGESGTGKGLLSRSIHKNSSRATGPYVTVNCGSIPSALLESELFGYEQGAFTGAARRKIGKFELANGGTIFLDEIGDMPIDMQVKILRAIQDKEFERVGGNDTVKCNVRIIAATHSNLEEMINQGRFREDLYYRLNVIPIYMPPLREHREDIPLLINHFIKKLSSELKKEIKGISRDAECCLQNYDWPGNIRELENTIERMIALTDHDTIEMDDVPSHISNLYDINCSGECKTLINMKKSGDIATLKEYEEEIIKQALLRFGSFNAAGKALGVTHKTVALKAKRYNIIK